MGEPALLFEEPDPTGAALAVVPAYAEPPADIQAGLAMALGSHDRLERAFDTSLTSIVEETENAALSIIGRVRSLHDAAQKLVSYLDGTSIDAGNLGREIVDSLQYLTEIGTFIQGLPERMKCELEGIQAIVREIKQLSDLTQSVQAISMQSHLLAINASIEASHAGNAGTAFRVVADEMRLLAANSNGVATKINQGLSRCRAVIEGGMAASITESHERLAEVSNAGATIAKLHDNLEDMNQYYKTRFAIVTKHNADLAGNIADVLGFVQTQDVVRQCVERLQAAMNRRNDAVHDAAHGSSDGDAASVLAALSAEIDAIADEYVNGEANHQRAQEAAADEPQGPRIELF